MELISRSSAKSLGLTRFFTGIPCRHGHICERRVCDGYCVICRNFQNGLWEKRNPDKTALYKSRDSWKVARKATRERHEGKPESKAQRARHYLENRERILARVTDYAKREPEKPRQHKRNYKSRKKGASGSHTAEQIAELLMTQQHRCANRACGVSIREGYHADHIMPLVRDGSNDISNIQLLCQRCNHRKNDKHPLDWARENGLLV
jgi:5-methylcytosine-specific restriction endonuclease McrA